ncbi:MAG: hypothetical protein K6F51_00810 [Acetatifactor sp.]|nr:hypothetical protein [Acetatifactor sp.]
MLKSRKMKVALMGIVAILLILLFPIPDSEASMDDGGTRGYTALTYQMVRWNRIMPSEEVYDKWAIYWFPDHHKSIEELWRMEMEKY